MPFRNRLLYCFLLLPVISAALACQGNIAPMVARAGTTIIIPLSGSITDAFASSGIPFAYGGQNYTDHQRGGLVFYLVDYLGEHRLVTRACSSVVAHPSTGNARGETYTYPAGVQFIAVVDIPAGIPSSVYDIEVYHQFPGVEPPQPVVGAYYAGQLEVIYDDTENFTPLQAYAGGWFNVSGQVYTAIPDPEVRFRLNPKPWAVELSVTYPPDVINVVDALPSLVGRGMNHGGVVWYADNNGEVAISAAAEIKAIDSLSLVFKLDNPEVEGILSTGQLGWSVVAAYDQNGVPMSGVTVSSVSIR